MTHLHSEHVIALTGLIMGRLIYRRLRKMPDVIETVASRLDAAINRTDPDRLDHYALEWQKIIRDPAALREALIGSSSNSMFVRKSRPIRPSDVGLDFKDLVWRRGLREAASRIARKEVLHGRTWSISGFKMFTAYPSPESSPEFCSFEDIKEMSGRDGVLVLRAMEARKIPSYRRPDVEAYAARQKEIDQLLTEIGSME